MALAPTTPVAIVGATGVVGVELLSVLEKRGFPLSELRLFARSRSVGQHRNFKGAVLPIEALPEGPLSSDLVLASAGGELSKRLAPSWVEGGAIVVDNSSAWRYTPEVPLVVPEINPEAAIQHQGIIANPNCTTAILAVALWPLHRAFGIKRAIVSTYQAASGAGALGMSELLESTREVLAGHEASHRVFSYPLAFNVIPHIDSFQDNGYTREEMKVVWETRKIFGEATLAISATAVRVPTLRAHAEAVTVELEKPATPQEAHEVLAQAPGLELVDDPSRERYPMPQSASGKWNVEVGRLRQSLVFEGGLDFFVAGDQLLKGAALNTVQIAELL